MLASGEFEYDYGQIYGQDLIDVWPEIEGFFANACRRSPTHLTPALILKRALDGQCDIWIVHHKDTHEIVAAGATYIRTEPEGDVFVIESLGGREIKKWGRNLLADLEARAYENGTKTIEIEGRAGWQRFLPDYELKRIIIGKDIRHGWRWQ